MYTGNLVLQAGTVFPTEDLLNQSVQSVKFGSDDQGLLFSHAVELKIPVALPDGMQVKLDVIHEGQNTNGMTSDDPSATCSAGRSSSPQDTFTVQGGSITVYTCGASTFLVSVGTSAFVTTWKTDNPGTSASNQITIPTIG